jgi:hypothetical protein
MPHLTEALKSQIDNMSHLDMCRRWRFAKSDDPCIAGMAGDYLARRIQALSGVNPAVSTQIGWDDQPEQEVTSMSTQS